MAVDGNTRLYPPVIETFSPAFVSSQGCRVYFSISAYNSISEYQEAHITVTKQTDNLTALNKEIYPSQVKLISADVLDISTVTGKIPSYTQINYDPDRTSDDKYFIALQNSDIQSEFKTGLVYKVQIRFSESRYGNYTPTVSNPQSVDTYLSQNLSAFSEWSKVSLVQAITHPELELNGGNNGQLTPAETNYWYSTTLEVVGTLTTDASDPLRSYDMTLYNYEEEIVEESGTIFPTYQSRNNELNYVFKHELEDGSSYILELHYVTEGLYEETYRFNITTMLNLIEQLDAYLEAEEDEENGRIGIHIQSYSIAPFAGKITIRRTSSLSNFELWEDVHTVELRADKLDYLWYDYTIESGVWYKYLIQKRDILGNRGIVTKLDTPLMLRFDSLFLGADSTQIKIKFDPQISSFQRVVSDTKIDTIGGKYPYIKRNGATSYRSFPISGRITFLMDGDKIFTSREDMYDEDTLDLYKEYNRENRINIFNDITYERHFREKVMDFLYKHNVKLYRSATEGNILVKLMDISFTPDQALGRRIYSFSCTAYEVDEFTLERCDYYGIQHIDDPGNTGEILSYELSYEGQWLDTIPANTEFVHLNPVQNSRSILEKYYSKYERAKYILSVNHLDYLRIEIYDEPYLIYNSGATPVVATTAAQAAAGYLGYIIYVNGIPIVVAPDGIYELKNDEVAITSLKFAKDTNGEIRYHAVLNQTEDTSQILALTSYSTHIGQEYRGFIPGESLYTKLWNKYYMEHPGQYYQNLVTINGIRIEANPGTVAWVREEGETNADRHVIGPTGSLDFYDPESVIADVYFSGMHFEPATEAEIARDILPEGKYYYTGQTVKSLNNITNPQERYVYYVNEAAGIRRAAAASTTSSTLVSNPKLATLITANGLPIFYLKEDGKNIAIIETGDVSELQTYLTEQGYLIYTVDSITFDDYSQMKTANLLNGVGTIDFALQNPSNQTKLTAFNNIIQQYKQSGSLITVALKRQIWGDVSTVSESYYIYLSNQWYVFDMDAGDAVCPVPVLIDYICETMKGYYRTGT